MVGELMHHARKVPSIPLSRALDVAAVANARRIANSQTFNPSEEKRAKRFGTFMASSLGALGVHQEHSISPLTTYFSFGPIAPHGAVTARIVYDHRVMDGRTVGRCLAELQS